MNKSVLKFAILSIIFTLALSVNYLFAAWSGPTQPPPGGNTPTPVNVSMNTQTKTGAFIAGGLRSLTDLYVDGNVGIGMVNPSQKLDVDGGVKVGNTTSANAGTIRWSGSDFEGYDGVQWKSFTATGSGGGVCDGVSNPEVCYACVVDGGSWKDDQNVCYFPGNNCLGGWVQKNSYSSTISQSCGGSSSICTRIRCSTGGHTRTNQGREQCTYITAPRGAKGTCGVYSVHTCSARPTEIGCTKN